MVVKRKEETIDWEVNRVVETTQATDAWGKDWPVGTKLVITTVKDYTCEVRFPGGYVGTLPKAFLKLTPRRDEHMNEREEPRTTNTTTEEPKTFTKRERQLQRKAEAINIAKTASDIMDKAKEARETAGERERPGKSKRVRAVKPSSDAIPLKKICTEIDIEPRIARRLLRLAKKEPLAQVDGRWEWPKDKAPEVSSLLKRLAEENCRE